MLASRMDKQVTVTPMVTGTADRYGNLPYESSGAPVVYDAWIEQISAEEDDLDRETRISRWRLILPPDAVINTFSMVEYDSLTFTVIGRPKRVFNWQGVHHIECELSLIET